MATGAAIPSQDHAGGRRKTKRHGEPMHETKATIRLRKRAGHAVLQGVALSRGVAIGGAAEVWAGGRPMAIRRRKRGTDATAGGWEPEIMISEAKDSQARSSTLSARFFFEKGVDYWCFVCGVGCRTVAWPRRFSSHFLIRAAGKSLLLSSSSALSIDVYCYSRSIYIIVL